MVWHVVMSGFLFLVLSHALAEFCHTCWSWHTQLKGSRTHEVWSDWFFRGNPIWKLNWLVQIKHLISSELLKDKLDECDGQKNKSFSRQDKTTERQFSFSPNFSRGFLGRPKMTALIMLANVHWCASCNKTPLSHSPYPTGSPWPPHLSSPTHSSANGVAVVSSRKNKSISLCKPKAGLTGWLSDNQSHKNDHSVWLPTQRDSGQTKLHDVILE